MQGTPISVQTMEAGGPLKQLLIVHHIETDTVYDWKYFPPAAISQTSPFLPSVSLSLTRLHPPSRHTHSACFRMHGGPFIIGGVLQLTNKYLEMKSSSQDMFTQTLLRDFMVDVPL